MKELSIEEKAKRYDKAKYIMKEYIESGNAGVITENTIKKAFPELSESEDERIRNWLIETIKQVPNDSIEWETIDKSSVLAWLEKQGEKSADNIESSVQNKPWSEEDERIYQSIMDDTVQENQLDDKQTNWLKSLKGRVQPKQEWSEEDEEYFNSIAHALSVLLVDPSFDEINLGHTAWFKSLKDRYTWKPSDEQMKALKEACDEHWEPDGLDPLYTLYQDLKKLIE